MKARTIGPILMMALGATLMVAPASGWVGAEVPAPCDTSAAAGLQQPCTCPTEFAVGVVVTCDTIVVDTVVETVVDTTPDTAAPGTTAVDSGGGNAGGGLPDTGSSTPWLILIGGTLVLAGGALLVTGRNRRPADQA